MSDYQKDVLKVLVEKYFEGGNGKSDTTDALLKRKLDVIAEFVEKNLSD